MFGFPVNLFDGGLTPVKFTPDAHNGFPKIQQREIFYSKRDGLWSDTGTWETASGRVGLFPNANDDVYIRHEVELNLANLFCNNLYVSQYAVLNTGAFFNKQISIFGDLKSSGNIKATSNFCQLNLYGIDNFINSFSGTPGYINILYARLGDQPIMNLLLDTTIGGTGVKYLKENTILRSYNTSGTFDAKEFDLTINGSTNLQSARFTKTGPGKLTFIGNVSFSNGGAFILSGNPSVEFRGGISASGAFSFFDSGTTEWAFTTNNQSITGTYFEGNYINCPVVLKNGITLTIDPSVNLCLNNTIDATTSAAKVINKGNIIFGTLASVGSFLTSQFDFTTFANTISYSGNYTATIPATMPTFHNLTIAGTGTKSLGINTTLNGNLNVGSSALGATTFELSTFNLVVTGITKTWQQGLLKKSGSGNLTFIGEFQFWNYGSSSTIVDFSGGNPNVELRGGIEIQQTTLNFNFLTLKTGTGTWTFTTNNQTIRSLNGSGQSIITDCTFLISGAITITNSITWFSRGTIDGNNAASTLLNNAILRIFTIQPMATGVFDITTNATNTIGYFQNGNFTIPLGSYRNLEIGGSSGTKVLSQNTTINGNLTINLGFTNLVTNGILDCTTFDLVVNGTTTCWAAGTGRLYKSGAGNITFIGQLISNDYGQDTIDLTGGNPNVELRGGISTNQGNQISSPIKTGTGTWTFSTNNQTIIGGFASSGLTFNCNILISGTITLIIQSLVFVSNGTINGNNALSKLLLGISLTLTHRNTARPMITGILDASTNLNTFIYGNLNQDILGSPTTSPKQVYRNLTLNGTGVKTLQGYVSVLNTYTLTAPATLANNGFTLTNP